MKIKNYDSFLSLHCCVQFNPGPTSDACFVCKRTLNKKSFCCTKRDLRAQENSVTRSFLTAINVVTVEDERIYNSIMFISALTIEAIENHLC